MSTADPQGRASLPGFGASERPLDPRNVLNSIGAAVYDWDLGADTVAWGLNAAELFNLDDLTAWSSGRGFGRVIEPGSGTSRHDAILNADARDAGSGVVYATRYAIRTPQSRLLEVEDTGRWFGDSTGRPAFAHGIVRIGGDLRGGAPGGDERTAFLRQVGDDVAEAVKSGRPLTIFALSVDDLSGLNDRYGFDGADEVIRGLLQRLGTCMRRRDRFVRYSGNRFALALRSCSSEEAPLAAERFARAFSSAPIETGSGPVTARLLVGAATAPAHALEAAHLLRRAEESLALAKRRKESPFVLYDAALFRTQARRGAPSAAAASAEILGLLNDRRIVLATQPVVDAHTRETVFSEALLRVRRDDGIGLAGEIIPAMEQCGLVPLVDARILELAADHLAQFPEERLSVNLSPMTLESADWLTTLASHLGSRPGIASRLILEITETAAVRDPAATGRRLDAMKALGVSIAIDDFGAGHTSFRHLRNFPIDIVKLDGLFVQNLSRSTNDRFFVRTLIDLAGHLGLATVAEWVENEETARLLAGWGVDYLQGDHTGRPALAPPQAAPPRQAARS